MSHDSPLKWDQPTGRLLLEAKQCNGDLMLPAIPYENTWDVGIRAFIYLLALCYLFLGVAISADTFMSAIEVITSKTRSVMVRGEEVEIEVWNSTVANLTLMALGSSAPEILLAVVETCSLKFQAGELGPGTIVGSAAFNLLFITAICISCLKPTEDDMNMLETRRIEEFGVFIITAVASLFAYFWMIIVLEWVSKERVELWEALVTLLMFPVLVWVSWAQDRGWWQESKEGASLENDKAEVRSITDHDGHKTLRHYQHAMEHLQTVDEAALSADPSVVARIAAQEEVRHRKKSRLEYRIQATRRMAGGRRIYPTEPSSAPSGGMSTSRTHNPHKLHNPDEMTLGFDKASYPVLENCGEVKIIVKRQGQLARPCTVQFDTSDGTAVCGEDYVHSSGVLEFKPHQAEREIAIEIIDDDEWEPDENFFVRLFNASAEVSRMELATTQVLILNDDDPGKIEFGGQTCHALNNSTSVSVPVARKDGYDGNVLVFVKTMDGTALAGRHYETLPEDYELHFPHEETLAHVEVKLIPQSGEMNATFTLEIVGVEPEGCTVGETTMCTCIISNDRNYQRLMTEVVTMMDAQMGKYEIGSHSWSEQFTDAMNMAGDEEEEPQFSDYLMHFVSFYWKVLHAIIPPTDYYGGWGTFCVSLVFIGVITALVGDIAKMFGCCVGLEDEITAITFVALGTSLPDTFASVEATNQDDNADAAITNVTGSNSVNVFLGLGLPWTMATLYHASEDTPGGFQYPSDGIVFSVFVFFGFACGAIILLIYRRFFIGSELGGPKMTANVHSLLLAASWLAYIIISCLRIKGQI